MNTDSPAPHAVLPQPTGQLGAADRARLVDGQLDELAAALLNLTAEVASLAERVRALEAGSSGDNTKIASTVDDLVRRVLAPLADP